MNEAPGDLHTGSPPDRHSHFDDTADQCQDDDDDDEEQEEVEEQEEQEVGSGKNVTLLRCLTVK